MDEKEKLKKYNCIAFVDGSYNAKTKRVGGGIVFITMEKGQASYENIAFGQIGEYAKYHNVAGEVLAAEKAVEMAVARNFDSILIVHDYIGISAWVTGAWRAKNELTQCYRDNMRDFPIVIEFEKVQGHSGDKNNDKADILAKIGAGVRT